MRASSSTNLFSFNEDEEIRSILSDDEEDQPMISKQNQSLRQLDTSEDISFMTPKTDNQSDFRPNQNTDIEKLFQQLKNAAFKDSSSIDQIFLDVTIRKSKKTKIFANLDEINIIEEKRTRQFNSRYAGMATLKIEQKKIPRVLYGFYD